MEKFYVLYDARCGLCSWARLADATAGNRPSQFYSGRVGPGRASLPGTLPAGRTHRGTRGRHDRLWGGLPRRQRVDHVPFRAFEEYREWANRLAHPILRPLARQGFALVFWPAVRDLAPAMRLASENEIAETLRGVIAPACAHTTDEGCQGRSQSLVRGETAIRRTAGTDPRP